MRERSCVYLMENLLMELLFSKAIWHFSYNSKIPLTVVFLVAKKFVSTKMLFLFAESQYHMEGRLLPSPSTNVILIRTNRISH